MPEKKPLVEWKKWQTQRQTKQEFDNLPLARANGFGIICGKPNNEGLYVSVVDHDIKPPMTQEAIAKGKEILKDFPITQLEGTGNKGTHNVYYSRTKVQTVSLFHDDCALELLAEKKLCIMAPSQGYVRLNDSTPTILPDMEEKFYEILKLHGFTERKTKPTTITKPRLENNRIRFCCREALARDNHIDHLMRLAIASEYKRAGYPNEDIVQLFRTQDDFDHDKCLVQVESADPSKMARQETIKEYGYCYPECQENCKKRKVEVAEQKEEKTIVFKPFMELPDGRLAEQAFDGKEVYFLVYNPQTESVAKVCEVDLEGFTLKPIDNDEVRQQTVLLPSDVEEYESEEKLTQEIRDYLNRWHEAPDQLSRTVDIYYCYLTYIYDLTPQLPYRRYLAPWGRGKSAWLETLGWICYRGIVLAGSDTDKSVVRKMNNWRGTALIDEADFGNSTLYAFLIKILNIGYDKKTGYYHRSDDNDPNKILSYGVYGPKLLATREKYMDLALESRCLTTIGRQNANPIPLFRMDKFLAESQTLRNKLMMWRFRNYSKIKLVASQLEDKGMAAKVYDGADSVSSRVKQVILPLWLIAGDSMKQTLTEMAKTFDNLLKIEDPDYLLQLQARDAIQEIIADELKKGEHKNEENILIEAATQETFYVFPLSLISRTVLTLRGAKAEEITVSDVTSTSKSLKGIFESVLGFHIRIGKKKRREVLIPPSWLKEKPEKPEKENGLEKFFEGGGSL